MRTLAGIVLCFAVCCLGCGGGDGKVKLYSVQGKVTVGGKALTGCSVNFTTDAPAKGAEPVYSGTLGPAGEFQLKSPAGDNGAAPGKYKVSFTVVLSQDAAKQAMMASGGGKPPAPPPAPFPAEYGSNTTSPKEVEVKAQSNTIDISI